MVDLPITKWIKKKIRRLIAIVEDTDVATHSIASGKYVVWKGDLYKATAAIAIGGTLSLSNLSPVSDGGLNEISELIANNSTIQTGTIESKVSFFRTPTLIKCGKTVSFKIEINGGFTANTAKLIAVLPVGFRPNHQVLTMIGTTGDDGSINGQGYVLVNPNGTVNCVVSVGGAFVTVDVTFIQGN